MYEWHRLIQTVVDEIDERIQQHEDEKLTLHALAGRLGYSGFHMTRQFKALSGLSLRDYLRLRRLAFALIEVRDTKKNLLGVALDYGFSSQEAFTRAFKAAYGITPRAYRNNPAPVVLRTKINTFDRYIFGTGEIGMVKATEEIKVYFVSIPAHKYLHIKRYDSNGYWDFWKKQDEVPGGDCDTVCALLDSIDGKLDGADGVVGKFSGQIMAYLHEEDGRCAESYGVRLPAGYDGALPEGMLVIDVPEAEYLVFEHGPFDFEKEAEDVGEKLAQAMAAFSYTDTGYAPDEQPGRVAYFYFDSERFEKRIKPVVKL